MFKFSKLTQNEIYAARAYSRQNHASCRWLHELEDLAYFAANVLSARGALLTVLAHFFEQGRWGTLLETNVEQQSLSTEDRVYLLLQAALYLTVTKETQAPEVRLCYERAEELCLSLNRPKFLFLYSALVGRWRYSLMSDKLSRTLELAEEVHLLAQARNDSALLIGAYDALGATLLHLGDFERARRFATCGVEIWRSRAFLSGVEELMAPAIACLCIQAETKWHFGEIASCRATLSEAKSLAKKLNDVHGLVQALSAGGFIAYCEREASEVQRLASEMLDLSTRHNFAFFRSGAAILRGWAQSALGDTTQGVLSIEHGVEAWRGNGVVIDLSLWLALKAEALHLAGLTFKSLETLTETEEVIKRSEERYWSAGRSVCEVIESNLQEFAPGDIVLTTSGWQEYSLATIDGVRRVDRSLGPISYALGVLGMPGLTAYTGLLNIGKPRPGETVVVAAASGAVGSVVGQLGKIKGCRVVGAAGGQQKCAFVEAELGFDICIDHHRPDFGEKLKAACPNGIDIYFENVGGAVFEGVLPLLNNFARIPVCGLIAHYSDAELPPGPDRVPQLMRSILVKRLTLSGFIVTDYLSQYPDFVREMTIWLREGRIKYREDITDGLENAPRELIRLLKGGNFGKKIIRVEPTPTSLF